MENFTTPKYLAWQPIFSSLLDLLKERMGVKDQTEVILQILGGHEHLPLLSVMMPDLQLLAPKRPNEDDLDPLSASGYDLQSSFIGATPGAGPVGRSQSSIFDYAFTKQLDTDIAAMQ